MHEEVIKKQWTFIGDSSDDTTLKCHDGAVEETGGDLQEWAWRRRRRRAGQQEEQGAERAAEAGQNGYARMQYALHCATVCQAEWAARRFIVLQMVISKSSSLSCECASD